MSADSEATAQTLDIPIEKLVYGGEGLARTPEGVVLVPGVIPGERVSVRLEERKKGVRRGQLLEVATASPDRVAAGCPYYGRCGGCQYQHISYARQLALKQEILRECLERIGRIRLEGPVAVSASEPFSYRNRARFQVEKQGSEFRMGYREMLSHRLCAVECCPISSPAINDVVANLCGVVGADCFPDGAAELELFASDKDSSLLATVYATSAPSSDFGDRLRSAIPALESVCWRVEAQRQETIWGSGGLTYRVGEFHFRVGHGVFFQTNRFLHAAMIQAVLQDLEGNRALDLYAGVGFFALPLARRFERVAAVEADDAAARDLAANVGVVGGRARAFHKPAEKFLPVTSHNWEVVVVDPPRSGLAPAVVEQLRRVRPQRLVYVSCDPTTLARDLARLTPDPYRIRSVELVDQFPQTFHIESVVHLEQSG
jgi:23S rRNA (uracil1939-C5)-methyltransferase